MHARKLSIAILLLAVGSLRAEEQKPKLLPEFIVHKHQIQAVAFSPDGNLLAVAGGEYELFGNAGVTELAVWDLKARKKLTNFVGHKKVVVSVAFSPNGKTIATSSTDKSVRLWDIETGKQLAVLEDARYVLWLTFSPDGATLAGSDWPPEDTEQEWAHLPGRVLLWDVKGRKLRAKLDDHPSVAGRLAYSPDGKILAVATGVWDKKATESRGWYKHAEIKLWDTTTDKVKQTLTAQKDARIDALAFSPDSKTLASGAMIFFTKEEKFDSSRGEVTAWDLATGRVRVTVKHHGGVHAISFSPDGRLLGAVASDYKGAKDDTRLVLLDAKTLKVVAEVDDDASPTFVFSPKQRLIASPYDKKVKLWEIP